MPYSESFLKGFQDGIVKAAQENPLSLLTTAPGLAGPEMLAYYPWLTGILGAGTGALGGGAIGGAAGGTGGAALGALLGGGAGAGVGGWLLPALGRWAMQQRLEEDAKMREVLKAKGLV